jgi:hypothetical protein
MDKGITVTSGKKARNVSTSIEMRKGEENSHLYSMLDTAAVRKSPGIGIV